MLEEGIGALKQKLPVLLVLNKKDLIKPGEIAKRLEVAVLEEFHHSDSLLHYRICKFNCQ